MYGNAVKIYRNNRYGIRLAARVYVPRPHIITPAMYNKGYNKANNRQRL